MKKYGVGEKQDVNNWNQCLLLLRGAIEMFKKICGFKESRFWWFLSNMDDNDNERLHNEQDHFEDVLQMLW